MRKKLGLTVTTACGHTHHFPHTRWALIDLRGALLDCGQCDEPLFLPMDLHPGENPFSHPIRAHALRVKDELREWLRSLDRV